MTSNYSTEQDRNRLGNFDWNGWTDWILWKQLEANNFREVGATPGAYVIATNRAINRAIGTDAEGFLDVGETGKSKARTIRKRLREFHTCATNRLYKGHAAGFRYAYFYFMRHFPLDSLRVRWINTATKDEAHRCEGRILLTYLYRHGELPPLNYKFNERGLEDFEGDVIARCLGGCE